MATSTAAIATSDPRATAVGADVLRRGGNCIDAAVAAGLALFVLEPDHCGPGGDGFMLAWLGDGDDPVALVGAGAVAAAQRSDVGRRSITATGGPSVSVPGAMQLLDDIVRDHATMPFAALAAPAVALAEGGFEVRPMLADSIARFRARIADDPVLAALYCPDAVPVATGDRVVNPALARLLTDFDREGGRWFYEGPVAASVVATVRERGGFLTDADLAAHTTERVTAEATTFAGSTVWQITEPTQGRAVLVALAELERRGSCEWDVVADAMAAGMAAVGLDPSQPRPATMGTTCIAAADADGGVVSLVLSVCSPFGSTVGVPALGGVLHNRAAGALVTERPLFRDRPPHTLIPGLVTRGDGERIALGVAGGFMQSQGQVQLLVHVLGHGRGLQEAVDAPRCRVVHGNGLAVEPGHPLATVATSRHLVDEPGEGGFGAAQIAAVRADGSTDAAADRRRHGAAEVVRVDRTDG